MLNNNNKNKIKIFGYDFVKNNKNKCYILKNGIKYKLNSYFEIKNKKAKKLVIELVGVLKVTNLKGMFCECSSLISLPNISKWNINNVTNMNDLFSFCSSLISLPDISKWNVDDVKTYFLIVHH